MNSLPSCSNRCSNSSKDSRHTSLDWRVRGCRSLPKRMICGKSKSKSLQFSSADKPRGQLNKYPIRRQSTEDPPFHLGCSHDSNARYHALGGLGNGSVCPVGGCVRSGGQLQRLSERY